MQRDIDLLRGLKERLMGAGVIARLQEDRRRIARNERTPTQKAEPTTVIRR